MCFHYALSKKAQTLKNRYKFTETIDAAVEDNLPVYHANGFKHPQMPVITNNFEGITLASWGLIPSWVKDSTSAYKLSNSTLNARSETVFEKPSFRKSILKQRCLIPSTGFFEWKEVNGKKFPYFISCKSQEIFSFAGIWDIWVNPETGQRKRTYSIITVQANSFMEEIHNTKKRMPLILMPEDELAWLDNSLGKEDLSKMIYQIDSGLMQAYTISKKITSKKEDTNIPEITREYHYHELDEGLF